MVVCIHTCRIRETWYLCVDISAGKFAFRTRTRTRGGPSRTPPCRLRTQSGRTGNWAGVVRLHVGRNEVEEGSRKGSSYEALRPQHFAQSYSAWWETGLAISPSHTFELLAGLEVQRCEGAVLEGVNVAWKSRGGRCIW